MSKQVAPPHHRWRNHLNILGVTQLGGLEGEALQESLSYPLTCVGSADARERVKKGFPGACGPRSPPLSCQLRKS